MSEALALAARVLKLEFTVDSHTEDLKDLKDASKGLSVALQGIEKNLAQIKYLAIGGATVILGKEAGLGNLIKTALGM